MNNNPENSKENRESQKSNTIEQTKESLFNLNDLENRLILLEKKQNESENTSFLKKHLNFSNVFALLALVFSLYQFYDNKQKINEQDYEAYFEELTNIHNTYKSQGKVNDLNLLSRMIDRANNIEAAAKSNNKIFTPQQKVLLAEVYFHDRNFEKSYQLLDDALNYYLENNTRSRFIPNIIYAHYSCSKYLGKDEVSFDRYSQYIENFEEVNSKKMFWTQVYFQKAELESELEQFDKLLPTLNTLNESICPVCNNLYEGYKNRFVSIEYSIPAAIKNSEPYKKTRKKIFDKLEKE